jgi:hypothetical protein
MEGITHGIRQGGSKKVKIQTTVEEEPPKKMDSKAKLQKKFGIKTLEEKKKKEKSNTNIICIIMSPLLGIWGIKFYPCLYIRLSVHATIYCH